MYRTVWICPDHLMLFCKGRGKMTQYFYKFMLIFTQYFAILEGRRSDDHAKYSPYF